MPLLGSITLQAQRTSPPCTLNTRTHAHTVRGRTHARARAQPHLQEGALAAAGRAQQDRGPTLRLRQRAHMHAWVEESSSWTVLEPRHKRGGAGAPAVHPDTHAHVQRQPASQAGGVTAAQAARAQHARAAVLGLLRLGARGKALATHPSIPWPVPAVHPSGRRRRERGSSQGVPPPARQQGAPFAPSRCPIRNCRNCSRSVGQMASAKRHQWANSPAG